MEKKQQRGMHHAFLSNVAKDLPVKAFRPLKSWPVAEHRRESEMALFRSIPSQYNHKVDKG